MSNRLNPFHTNKSFYFRYAGQVSIGDEVLVEISNYLTPRKVIDISSSSMQGDYHFYFFEKYSIFVFHLHPVSLLVYSFHHLINLMYTTKFS